MCLCARPCDDDRSSYRRSEPFTRVAYYLMARSLRSRLETHASVVVSRQTQRTLPISDRRPVVPRRPRSYFCQILRARACDMSTQRIHFVCCSADVVSCRRVRVRRGMRNAPSSVAMACGRLARARAGPRLLSVPRRATTQHTEMPAAVALIEAAQLGIYAHLYTQSMVVPIPSLCALDDRARSCSCRLRCRHAVCACI
jgi:hypothetical protein